MFIPYHIGEISHQKMLGVKRKLVSWLTNVEWMLYLVRCLIIGGILSIMRSSIIVCMVFGEVAHQKGGE